MNVRFGKLAVALALVTGCSSTGSQSRGTSGSAQGSPTSSAEPSAQPGSSGAQASQGTAGQDPMMKPGPAIKGHAEDQVVSGQVGQVSAHSVAIESDRGGTTTLEIVPETAIVVDGQDATYVELQEGQPVRASYSEVEGHDVAVEIQIGAPASSSGTGLGSPSGGPSSTPEPAPSGPSGSTAEPAPIGGPSSGSTPEPTPSR